MAKIFLYDTTLRDGTQGEGVSLTVDDKLRVLKRLDKLGIHYAEGGWPGSNPKDIEFFQRAGDLQLQQLRLTAFGSTRRASLAVEDDPNLAAILESGVKAAAIFGKTWDLHVREALRTTLEENLRMIYDSISYLKSHGLEVIYDAEHFFDGYRANPQYALETVRQAAQAGADSISLCDTCGGTMPWVVEELVTMLRGELATPLAIHAHNDSGLAVANSLSAVRAGATGVQGTINGYGERNGNADLCVIIPNLMLKLDKTVISKEQLASLTQVSRYVQELANQNPDPRQPYVGASAFAHKGGIHVSAILKHPQTYEHIEPELVGNERRVLVSELAGISNIIYKAQEFNLELDRNSPVTKKLVSQIKELEHTGYQFEGADGTFELLLRKALGQISPLFVLEGFRLITEKREDNGDPISEATIKLRVGESRVHTAAEGDGPVNALDNALRKALETFYPQLEGIKLSDYKVRVIDEKSGTAAKVRVLIQSKDEKRSWGTVGVSTNIIEASWRALVDSLEYGILCRGEEGKESKQHLAY